jgi:hypothetical protein
MDSCVCSEGVRFVADYGTLRPKGGSQEAPGAHSRRPHAYSRLF